MQLIVHGLYVINNQKYELNNNCYIYIEYILYKRMHFTYIQVNLKKHQACKYLGENVKMAFSGRIFAQKPTLYTQKVCRNKKKVRVSPPFDVDCRLQENFYVVISLLVGQ